jgi:peroxiredoxin
MGGKQRRVFSRFSVVLIFLSLSCLTLPNKTDAKSHFWNDLWIIKFEKMEQAPSFRLKDLDGEEVTLEDHRGKIIFLHFWATWCMPCREEIASIKKLSTEFKDRDFIILTVDVKEGSKKVRAFQKEFKLNFPILLDSEGRVCSRYGVRLLPTVYLIDREGYFIGMALGFRDWASKRAFELVNYLLIGKPDSYYE